MDMLTQRFYGPWPKWPNIPNATLDLWFEMLKEKTEKRSIGQVELLSRLHKRRKNGTCVCPRAAKALFGSSCLMFSSSSVVTALLLLVGN
ncbi:hypothetical protein CRG98_009066 [Punica granatum]|uniref:Uncharacterized protein n=1 Tax=Punica granatum TaxID=22663 RepID=A0A2I0KQ09_PUNGR|nr:hypothetical protein CRG98_009066 [Punica granatum]